MPEPKEVNEDEQDGKVDFSAKQQEIFNKKIDEKFREAFQKAEKKYKAEYEGKLAEKETAITELKTKLEETQTKHTEGKPAEEEVAALQFKIREAQNTINLLEATSKTKDLEKKRLQEEKDAEHVARIAERKTATLLSAAQKFGFYRPDQVIKLVDHEVEFNEPKNKFDVLRDGQVRLNKTLSDDLTIDEYLQEFAEQNPHLVKGSNTGGAGSGEGTSSGSRGKVFTRSEIKAISDDPKKYAEMRDEIFRAMKEGRVKNV